MSFGMKEDMTGVMWWLRDIASEVASDFDDV